MGFRSVVLIVYALGSFYVLHRLGALVPTPGILRRSLFGIGFLLWATLPLGLVGGGLFPKPVTDVLQWVGFHMLPVLLYTGMAALVVDLWAVLSRLLPLPACTLSRRRRGWIAGGTAVVLVVAGGYLNALFPRIHSMAVTLPSEAPAPPLRIAVVTDLHAGAMVHNSRLHRIVDLLRDTSPDAVLLVGDTVDGNMGHAQEAELAEELRRIEAPLGVFAVSGNHEFYAGIGHALAYLRQGNVRILEDETVLLGGRVLLAGRIDIQGARFGYPRAALREILAGSPRGVPVLVMDHAPNFDEAPEAGVALQFSGHTHHGQLFPFNAVVHRLFGFSSGWHRQDDTLFYVSPGVGTWGPPVRTTARPEVVLCTVRFSPALTAPVVDQE